MTGSRWPQDLFQRIARPRLPGTPALAEIQEAIATQLRAFDYRVDLLPFVTSQRRLTAVTVAGAGLAWVALITAPFLVVSVPARPVTITGLATLAAVTLLALGISSGRLPLYTKTVEGRNIVARRGTPRCWLMAHSDSKAQRVSLLGRVVAVLLALAGMVLLVVSLVVRLTGPLPVWVAVAACVPALVGGGVLSFSRARNASPGAVDNATGIIAALVAADALRMRNDVGVIITDAEEFGLEGAHAWAETDPWGECFVNFDGLDDRGAYRVMRHSSSPDADDGTARLADLIANALQSAGAQVTVAALPLGVLVDGLVLARSGKWGVTVSRGDWRTLHVVHTRGDSPQRVTAASAVSGGTATARAVEQLLASAQSR